MAKTSSKGKGKRKKRPARADPTSPTGTPADAEPSAPPPANIPEPVANAAAPSGAVDAEAPLPLPPQQHSPDPWDTSSSERRRANEPPVSRDSTSSGTDADMTGDNAEESPPAKELPFISPSTLASLAIQHTLASVKLNLDQMGPEDMDHDRSFPLASEVLKPPSSVLPPAAAPSADVPSTSKAARVWGSGLNTRPKPYMPTASQLQAFHDAKILDLSPPSSLVSPPSAGPPAAPPPPPPAQSGSPPGTDDTQPPPADQPARPAVTEPVASPAPRPPAPVINTEPENLRAAPLGGRRGREPERDERPRARSRTYSPDSDSPNRSSR